MTTEGRILHATYGGRTYEIPEIWMMGFCSARGQDDSPRTIQDGIAWWAYQTELAEREGSQ